jgi:hypothetical protein
MSFRSDCVNRETAAITFPTNPTVYLAIARSPSRLLFGKGRDF